MQIQTKYNLTEATKTTWSGVFGFRPERDGLVEIFGEMFAVMSLRSQMEFDLGSLGGWLFDELQSKYFDYSSAKINIHHLEASLRAVKLRLESILERETKLAETGIDWQLGVVTVKGGVLYAAVVGEAHVYMHRMGEVANLSDALLDPDMQEFMRTGSLRLESDDRILLATSSSADHAQSFELKQNLEAFSTKSLPASLGAALMVGYDMPEVLPSPEIEMLPEQDAVDLPDDEPSKEEEELAPVEDLDLEPTNSDSIDLDIELDEQDLDEDTSEPPVRVDNRPRLNTGVVPRFDTSRARVQIGAVAANTRQRLGDLGAKARSGLTGIPKPESLNNLWARLQQTVAPILQKVVGLLPGRASRSEIYLRGADGQERWRMLAVVGVVAAVVIFIALRRAGDERDREFKIKTLEDTVTALKLQYAGLEDTVGEAASGTDTAKQQEALNSLGAIQQTLQPLAASEPSTTQIKNEITDLTKQVADSQDSIYRITPFTEPLIVNDLAANFQGANPGDMVMTEGNLYLSDATKGVIYRVGTGQGSQAGVAISDLNGPYLLETDTDGDLVVVDQNEDSVVATVDIGTGMVRRHAGLSKSKQGELATIDIWSNKSLYAISATQQSLVRQPLFGGNYQIPNYATPWRKDSNFGKALDMAVDYWVYVLVEGKGLMRYLSGGEARFNYRGLLPDLLEATKQSTALEVTSKYVFLADSVGKRVLQFRKDPEDGNRLNYMRQYAYRGAAGYLSNIKEIVVNEQAGQMFLLDGTSVLRVPVDID